MKITSNSQFGVYKEHGGVSGEDVGSKADLLLPAKSVCISTLPGGQMLPSSPQGRVHGAPRQIHPRP